MVWCKPLALITKALALNPSVRIIQGRNLESLSKSFGVLNKQIRLQEIIFFVIIFDYYMARFYLSLSRP